MILSLDEAQAAMWAAKQYTLTHKAAIGDVLIAKGRETLGAPNDDAETIMADTIASFMHVCRRDGIDFEDVMQTADAGFEGDLDECEP